MMKKKILLTGANGYIGSSVANKLNDKSSLFLLSRSGGENEKNVTRIKGDITEKNVWKDILKDIDIVYHFAAQTSSHFSNTHPLLDVRTNLLPIINLIEICREHHYSPDIIFAGSVTETGFTDRTSLNGNNCDQPITVYDINKLSSEKYLQFYSSQGIGRSITLRLANVYGPGPASSSFDRGIVNLMIKKALKGENITIYGDGSYVRDYLHIDDVVSAFLIAAEKMDITNGNCYPIGTGVGHTILDMAQMIREEVSTITGKRVDILFEPFPENTSRIEYRSFVADSTPFKRDTGWSDTITLREGIKRTIEYFNS